MSDALFSNYFEDLFYMGCIYISCLVGKDRRRALLHIFGLG